MPRDIDPAGLTTDLAVTWLANPNTRASADDVTSALQAFHAALGALAQPAEPPADVPAAIAHEHTPAVSVRKSLASREHIVSMIDGKAYRSLTRHLSSRGITPDDYRQRFKLSPDYPMVAPAYARRAARCRRRWGSGASPLRTTAAVLSPRHPPSAQRLHAVASRAALPPPRLPRASTWASRRALPGASPLHQRPLRQPIQLVYHENGQRLAIGA